MKRPPGNRAIDTGCGFREGVSGQQRNVRPELAALRSTLTPRWAEKKARADGQAMKRGGRGRGRPPSVADAAATAGRQEDLSDA